MKARTASLNEMDAGAEARLVDNLTDKRYFETQNYFESRVTPGAVARARIYGTPGYPVGVSVGLTFRLGAKD